jgi:hypothetical protein
MVSQLSLLMQQMNASHRYYRTEMHQVPSQPWSLSSRMLTIPGPFSSVCSPSPIPIWQVQLMMKKQNLPRELRSRVEQYYTYLWHAHGTSNPSLSCPSSPLMSLISSHLPHPISSIRQARARHL